MASVVALTLLVALYALGPGPFLVRRLGLAPAERLVASIGASLLIVYLVGFGLFATGATAGEVLSHLLIPAIALTLTVLGWRDWATLLRSRQVRRMLLAWLGVTLFGLLLLSMVRNYSGGTWGGDWQEHYERSLFFRWFSPEQLGFRFIEQYPLPMRPPMANVIIGHLMLVSAPGHAPGADYEPFQIALFALNSLAVLPCLLLVGRLVKLSAARHRLATWTVAALLAASPVFTQNLTYAWTKLFAGFYALAAIAIYLRAMRRSSVASTIRASQTPRFVLAFAMLCAGYLVHFSVGPYGLFLGLHYLLALWWRRPRKWAEAAFIGGVSAAILVSWHGWSIVYYGPKTTFGSTSAVSDAAKMTPAQNVVNIAKNLGTTLVPTLLRDPGLVFAPPSQPEPTTAAEIAAADVRTLTQWDLYQESPAGKLRDFTFLLYQVSLPLGLGLAGLPTALWLMARVVRGREASATPVRRFWFAFVPVVYVVGTAVYGGEDRFGVAHICLQPLIYIGLCAVGGAVWKMTPRWRAAVVLALLVDAGVGVFLQAAMQHRLFTVNEIVEVQADGQRVLRGHAVVAGPDVPSKAGQNNLSQKQALRRVNLPLSEELPGGVFWGDRFAGGLPVLLFFGGATLGGLVFLGFVGLPRRQHRRRSAVPAGGAPSPSSRGKANKGRRSR